MIYIHSWQYSASPDIMQTFFLFQSHPFLNVSNFENRAYWVERIIEFWLLSPFKNMGGLFLFMDYLWVSWHWFICFILSTKNNKINRRFCYNPLINFSIASKQASFLISCLNHQKYIVFDCVMKWKAGKHLVFEASDSSIIDSKKVNYTEWPFFTFYY